jgi:endo-1,4-beta-D-glucanase Y
VRAFYDYWKDQYVVSEGTTPGGDPLYRISFGRTDPTVTVSEGQGYGMVIVALMAGYDPQAQVIFDGLWRFARANPSGIDSRLMTWHVPIGASGNDSAFDGDADIAYALLLADKQWGSDGAIDYQAEAAQVITAILESTIGPTSRLPMLGDWVNPNGGTYHQYTPRSSDFMPAHFRAYGRATHNLVWTEVISNSQAVITSLQANYSPTTGLLPDFSADLQHGSHSQAGAA